MPTFRGEEGLWREHRPEELATPSAFRRDPRLVWEWYAWRRRTAAECEPNAAHLALARWCREVSGVWIATQNVDGLHLAALRAVAGPDAPGPDDAAAAAREAALSDDVCLVVGTSAVVQPAASLASVAAGAGAALVEVNPEATPISDRADVALRAGAAGAIPALLADG